VALVTGTDADAVNRMADAAEPAADPGGGQPAGRAGPLPGQPDIGGKVAGEPELGVAKQTRSSNSFFMI